jgi:Fic family protein
MKIPQKPPDTRAFLKEAQPDLSTFLDSVRTVQRPTHRGRYLHWDKLRRLSPPDGLTHEQWWFGLKAARSVLLKDLPSKDVTGRNFRYALPDPAPEMLHRLDQNAAGQILIPEVIANQATRDQYIVRSLIEESITSSQLEGAATTRPVAKEMLRTGRPARDRDEQMIQNNYRAMQYVRETRDEPLTPALVIDLQRILTQNAIDTPSASGRLRRADEAITVSDHYGQVLHVPPPADQLEDRLIALCDFANRKTPDEFVHPVVRALVLHFWLAYDHPFVDGNGRCARGLFYWAMLSQGYWLAEYISISHILRKAPMQYGRAFLYTETDDNDVTYFILYHLQVLRDAIAELHQYLAYKAAEVREAEKLVRAGGQLNHRQIALLTHALRHPNEQYTIQSHRTSHNIVYETARTDLLELATRGLFTHRTVGRTGYFYPAADLSDRMKKL